MTCLLAVRTLLALRLSGGCWVELMLVVNYYSVRCLSVTYWNNAAIYLLLQDKLLWQRLLHLSWALKHLHFTLLHFFCNYAHLHLTNPWRPDAVHFRASRSETCLSMLMSLSFSNCWEQRVKSAYVYLLDRIPCLVGCGNGVEVVFVLVDDTT